MKKLTKTQQKMLNAITRGSWNEIDSPSLPNAGMLQIYPRRQDDYLSGENRSRELVTAESLAKRGLIEIDYIADEYGFITARIAT